MKFYHPIRKEGALQKICKNDVCQCAEGTVFNTYCKIVQTRQKMMLLMMKILIFLLIADTENCSLQKKEKIQEAHRNKKACESKINYGNLILFVM